MSKEETTVVEVETETTTVVDDQTTEQHTQTDTQPDNVPIAEIEEAATAQGWSPDKGELSALDFLSKGREFRDRLFDKVSNLEADNKRAYDLITQRFDKQDHKDHVKEVKSIQEQIEDAKAEGDAEKVDALYKSIPVAPASQPKVDPHAQFVAEWMSENSWFESDAEMTSSARGMLQAEVIKANGQQLPKTQLPIVLAEMKKMYPDKFKAKASPNANRGVDVDTKGKKVSKSKSSGFQRSDLTEAEEEVIVGLMKSGLDEKKLLAGYQRQRERQNG